MGNLQKHNPSRGFWDLGEEIDRLLWGIKKSAPATGEKEADSFLAEWAPKVDIYEDAEAFKVHAELPGVKREDIKLSVRDGVLTLRGERQFKHEEKIKDENYYRVERSYGSFARSFTLPKTVDASKIQANLSDGVLELVIPKLAEAKEKEIAIEVK